MIFLELVMIFRRLVVFWASCWKMQGMHQGAWARTQRWGARAPKQNALGPRTRDRARTRHRANVAGRVRGQWARTQPGRFGQE